MSALDSFPSNNKRNEPLSKDDAHEEANMLKAKLEINPDIGKIPTSLHERVAMLSHEGREPTAEDYDAALAAVEELKELAANEPATEKILNVFGRLAANSAQAVWIVGFILGKAVTENYEWSHADAPSDKITSYGTRFEDAVYQLRQLKSEAKKYS